MLQHFEWSWGIYLVSDQEQYLLYLLLYRHCVEVPSWFKMHLRILIYEKHNICKYIY